MPDAARIARSVLDRFEAEIAAKDVDALMSLCTDDVVLFGTARANVGAAAGREYIALVVESNATLRWHLDPIVGVHADEVLARVEDQWLIAHFHGSVPEA